MGTFFVDFEALRARTRDLRRARAEIIRGVEEDYRQIRSTLRETDGSASAAYREALDHNRKKALAAAEVVDRLINFMANASRQIQVSEEQMARGFRTPRR